jgi:hypothetical protein
MGKLPFFQVQLANFKSNANAVNVNDGSGGGLFAAGKAVTVTAGPAPSGQHFVKWVGDVVQLDDATKASATLTMPKAYVSIRATYAP